MTNKNHDHLLILGRQPALGIAELESLYGGTQVAPFGTDAAIVSDATVDFKRLGGSIKACQILAEVPADNWGKLERQLVTIASQAVADIPEGKIQLGLSVYDSNESPQRIMATGLTIKKAIKKAGRSVRLTPNQTAALSSAQVFHNHLIGPTGFELVVYMHDNRVIVARTTGVQDIDSYTRRDRGRPKRDSRVGMLPPKLAQIIINLSAGSTEPKLVLDPFCGTGVVLQEALLMGYDVYGTDLEPRMIDYSGENLDWLSEQTDLLGPENLDGREMRLETGDATNHQWEPQPDTVACETYLGRPFTTAPTSEILAKTISECDLIIKKFLRNISSQLPPNTRLCIAVPAWQVRPGQFRHLPLIDQVSDLGYNRVKFEQVRDEQLLYYREDQIVARQLLVLTKR